MAFLSVIHIPGTPDLLSLHAADPQRYPYLLQTLGADGWDILFAFPQQTYRHSLADIQSGNSHFIASLDQYWHEHNTQLTLDPMASSLPFRGGWFVYLGYELLHELEPTVSAPESSIPFPIGYLARIPAAILVNHKKGETILFTESNFDEYQELLRKDLVSISDYTATPVNVTHLEEENETLFLDGVTRIQHYIHAGDVFQVNLSRPWNGVLAQAGAAANLYNNLRQRNPAPFSGIADFGDSQIVSSSPERLAQVSGGVIETRPIAGTYPRSPDRGEDKSLQHGLATHPKERAEHIMLVDLERNDLGRLCVPGSVTVDELMGVHSYSFVHHIESNIRGHLRAGTTPGQIFRALFPGGTITGCPKVRTMQIIRELEKTPRLAYTGSMGYLNHDGGMDMNILIRSFMLTGTELSFRAGAGIVADSVPAKELDETRAKAKGLLKALEWY